MSDPQAKTSIKDDATTTDESVDQTATAYEMQDTDMEDATGGILLPHIHTDRRRLGDKIHERNYRRPF